MAHIVLVTGGARSGKSAYAQELAESLGSTRCYVATCPVVDAEMARRIARHQEQRLGRDWQTVEETLDLANAVRRSSAYSVLLIDCLTLWISNLLLAREQAGAELSEDDVVQACRDVLAPAREHSGVIVLVTNEVGMGIVPENALARRYRDLVGRCNQVMAASADRVVLMASGIAVTIKGEGRD